MYIRFFRRSTSSSASGTLLLPFVCASEEAAPFAFGLLVADAPAPLTWPLERGARLFGAMLTSVLVVNKTALPPGFGSTDTAVCETLVEPHGRHTHQRTIALAYD